jgi:hypothetical protein
MDWLEERRAQQEEAVRAAGFFAGFEFRDGYQESGLRFRHRAVADCNRDFRIGHYDHGNGFGVADVDGDGHLDFYFISQLGGNELWRGLGDGTFEELTETAGVGLSDRVSVTATFADLDNDGDPDLFVTTVKQGNVLFENVGGGRFRDITKAAGVEYVGHSSGIVAFDYDRDGLLDLFVANVGQYTTREVGTGGYFRTIGKPFEGHLIATRTEPSILYRNQGGLRFMFVTGLPAEARVITVGQAYVVDGQAVSLPE